MKSMMHQDTAIWDKLAELNEQLSKAGKAPVNVVPADPNLLDDDIAQMVNAGLVPATVLYDKIADAWAKVLPKLKVHHDVVLVKAPLCWAIQRNTPQLKAAVNDFIKSHSLGTAYGNTIARRYLKETKWVLHATSREGLKRFDEKAVLVAILPEQLHQTPSAATFSARRAASWRFPDSGT